MSRSDQREIPKPSRLLVVIPTWIGDAVMATPALQTLREQLPGAFIGGLFRPGIDQILTGSDFFDETHIEARAGVMGPKRAAAKIRPLRYDAALLLTNSFSSALTTRIAGIARRVGYERDGRSFLLSAGLIPPKRCDTPPFNLDTAHANEWAPIPACSYYMRLVAHILGDDSIRTDTTTMIPMTLATTPQEEEQAESVLCRAGLPPDEPFAILNPGGNNPAKRWPADRFAQLARQLHDSHNLRSVISGAPSEAGLTEQIVSAAGEHVAVSTANLGVTLGTLKAVIRRASIMITNDTGPRHIAAALGVPVVTLFGPTDHRWTIIPFDQERIVLADPTLEEQFVSNDYPERCAIEHINLDRVLDATVELLGNHETTPQQPGAAGAGLTSS